MNDFYNLEWLDRKGAPVAYGTRDARLDSLLAGGGLVRETIDLKFALAKAKPTDYLANNLGIRLCSPTLRAVIDEHRGDRDEIQWLDAHVITPTSKVGLSYSVLHLPSHPDVLDAERTIWARHNFVVKPVLAASKLGGHAIFGFPEATLTLVVRADVKAAIQRARCSGVDFSRVPVV